MEDDMVEKSESGQFWPSLYEPFRAFGHRLSEWLAPASEASSGETAYVISMELPGVREDDVELTVHDGVITVRGEKRTEEERKGDTWYFSERQYGAFRRSFRLPEDADGEKVTAEMKDGVLKISVARKSGMSEDGVRTVRISKG
jgi:HSP20 family protein